ncbi:hypothetical protein [Paenibacillus sp. IHBB 3054]|uniref:hypothetical protein n=1 Tax=Paenibacillus sp. IHBB 3054 TaxID=3425689 RepID=UPI003F665F49
MKIAITLLLYTLAFVWGCTRLRGEGSKLHRLWFGCILVWCAYENICGITETPHFNMATLYLLSTRRQVHYQVVRRLTSELCKKRNRYLPCKLRL